MSLNKQSFSKILVPIDGSEYSFRAAKTAITIAHQFNSEIIFLYVLVCPSQNNYVNLPGFVTPKQIEIIIKNTKAEANKWFKKINDIIKNEGKDIEFSTKIISTEISVYGEISEYAEKEKADLIVIGTRGRSGIRKLVLGSTASGVITYAHCPVLITR